MMPDFPFATVAFDLDGTLVDSNPDLANAINHALASIGRAAVPPAATRQLIGGGARLMLARALGLTGGMVDDATMDRLFALLLDHYAAHIADQTRAYPGCVAALEALGTAGCRLAVVTNKREAMARRLLDALDLAQHFTTIIGGDTLGPGRAKPAPDMLIEAAARCGGGAMAMVGDASFDADAARAAGMPCIIVSFGYNDRPAHRLGADAVIDHFDALVPTLRRLGPT